MDVHNPEDSLGTHSYLTEMIWKMFYALSGKITPNSGQGPLRLERRKPNSAKVTSLFFFFNTTDYTHVIINKIHMI